jgi:hypothetical protein
MFSKITIVGIDGRPGELEDAQRALTFSAAQMPGACCLLMSPECPKHLLPGIKHIKIAPLSYLEYSIFVTFALHAFIETEFALIIQGDSWVLNGAAFCDDFLEFDYLGAPTSTAEIITPTARYLLNGYDWVKHELSRDIGVRINFTMNGGFSLRSRKFLKTPSALGLDYRLRVPEIKSTKMGYEMTWPGGDVYEDLYHCVINRDVLDQAGIRFPPLSVGIRFAFEHLNPMLHGDFDPSKAFGHHAKMRRLSCIDPLTVDFTWSECAVREIIMEDRIILAFEKLGYSIRFAPDFDYQSKALKN